MSTTATNGMTEAKALRQARRIALALLAGQVLFLGVTAALIVSGTVAPGPAEMSRTLGATCVVVFAVLLPIAFILRRRLHVPADRGATPAAAGAHAAPENILKGHIVFFALCEMVTLLCLAVALVHGALVPSALLALMCMGVQATNVPRVEDAA